MKKLYFLPLAWLLIFVLTTCKQPQDLGDNTVQSTSNIPTTFSSAPQFSTTTLNVCFLGGVTSFNVIHPSTVIEKFVLNVLYPDAHLLIANTHVETKNVFVKKGDSFFNESIGSPAIYEEEDAFFPQMVITFTLYQDIKWGDGLPIVAEDSLFAFDSRTKSDLPPNRTFREITKSYHPLNSYQIRWEGIPNYQTSYLINHFVPPLPKHTLQNLDLENLSTTQDMSRLLGWGPFIIKEGGYNQTITFAHNLFSKTQPLTQEILIKMNLDFTMTLPSLGTNRSHLVACDLVLFHSTHTSLSLIQEQLASLTYITYPIATIQLDFIQNRPTSVFMDKEMREAIAYGLVKSGERELPPTTFLPGWGIADFSTSLKEGIVTGEVLQQYPYNPVKAQSLLDEMGWLDRNQDGIRENQLGNLRVRLGFLNVGADFYLLIGSVQQQLEALGMEVSLVELSFEQFRAFSMGTEENIDIDLLLYYNDLVRAFDCSFWSSIYLPYVGDLAFPDALIQSYNITSLTKYHDEVYNQLCAGIIKDKNLENWKQLQQIVAFDLPSIPLFAYHTIAFQRSEFEGFDPQNGNWNITFWILDEN